MWAMRLSPRVPDSNRGTMYRVGSHLFRRFCKMFSKNYPCLHGQHGSCSTAQHPGKLSEKSKLNLSEQVAAPPGRKEANKWN